MKNIKQILTKGLGIISAAMFPENLKCIVCNEEMSSPTDKMVCEACLKDLPFITKACEKCGEQLISEERFCLRCQAEEKLYNFARSPFIFEGKIIKLVHNLKYNEEKWLAKYLGKFMADTYIENKMAADFLVPVPITNKKFKARGYNQSIELAKSLSSIVGVPILECVCKTKETKSQTGFSAAERRENIKDTFEIKPEFLKQLKGKKILIIDDVYTTGATIDEICAVFKKSKLLLENIFVLTLAHTMVSKNKPSSK